tara:strand:+ start:935 stop:1351 length:417 start_codon:yes stop_codon:yes gene_type:complete
MKTVNLVEAMNYPEEIPDPRPDHHSIVSEIASRLQELDDIDKGSKLGLPMGAKLVNRLSAIQRRSMRAYRLILDLLGEGKSLSDSLETLGARHINSKGLPCKRQAWLQNAQEDVQIIKSIYPELGEVVGEVLKRRPIE